MGADQQQSAVLRVLIAEDTPRRQELLRQVYREHAWVMTPDAVHASRLVAAYDFDLISLDYDLEGSDTGEIVGEAIIGSRNAATPVLVHSMNPEGAELLAILLPHAQRVPIDLMVGTGGAMEVIRSALRRGVPTDWSALLSANR